MFWHRFFFDVEKPMKLRSHFLFDVFVLKVRQMMKKVLRRVGFTLLAALLRKLANFNDVSGESVGKK